MSRYELGLRRRSPNPNSPIPYSPALLSPYEPQVESWDAAPRFGQEHHQHEHAPTIRLVGPSDAGSSKTSYHAPEPSRSRSDDRDAREPRLIATDASLRRHGTDPKLYPSMGRQLSRGKRSTASLLSAENSPGDFERGFLDKPVPTLPLNIRRTKTPSRPPSVVSDHTAASSNATASKSVASSRVFFHNPFRRSIPQTRSSSPTLSARSTHSYRSSLTRLPEPMSRSASSLSTTSTLLGPHYETAGWDKFEKVNSSEATLVDKLKSTGVGEKLTYKVPPRRDGGSQPWPKLKWTLLLSVLLLMGYGFAGLGWSLTILLKTRDKADVTMVSDPDIVIFLTLASLLCVFSAFVGMTGLVLDSRPILAFYNLLLWPALLSLCLVGYTSYKRGNMQLDRKLNQSWSQFLDDEQRLRIQNTLKCCGYYNPLHDATYSKRCYPRSALPGCKANWTVFEKQALHEFATAAFTVIPFHLVNIVAALLCSNHVNRQFGKGLTPPQYRLRTADVRANAIAVLAKLPDTKRPASVLSRQRAISRKDRSRSNFGYSSSMGDSVTLVDRSDSRGEKGML